MFENVITNVWISRIIVTKFLVNFIVGKYILDLAEFRRSWDTNCGVFCLFFFQVHVGCYLRSFIYQNCAEVKMALSQYMFVLIHMVGVYPMLLKIGHVLETSGNGKWEGDLQKRGRTGRTLEGCIFDGRENIKLGKRVYQFVIGRRMPGLAKGQDERMNGDDVKGSKWTKGK